MFIVRTTRNTERHSLGRMWSFSMLKRVVSIEPMGFKELYDDQRSKHIRVYYLNELLAVLLSHRPSCSFDLLV
jgi:hypothetical protein